MKTIKLPTADLWSGIIIVSIIISAAFLTPDNKQQDNRKNPHQKVLKAVAVKGKTPPKITVQNQVFFSIFEINRK